MKRLMSLFLLLILAVSSVSLGETITDPPLYSNEYASLWFDRIEINGSAINVYFICENKTDNDMYFRLSRCLLNGWDIIENTTFDGFFRVSARAKKRDCFEFSKGTLVSGITDPSEVKTIDFSLTLSPPKGKDIFVQKDYTHYDLP